MKETPLPLMTTHTTHTEKKMLQITKTNKQIEKCIKQFDNSCVMKKHTATTENMKMLQVVHNTTQMTYNTADVLH